MSTYVVADVNTPISSTSVQNAVSKTEYTEKPNFIHVRMLKPEVRVSECTQGVPIRVGTIDVENVGIDQYGRKAKYVTKQSFLMIFTGSHQTIEVVLEQGKSKSLYTIHVQGKEAPATEPEFNPFLPPKVR